MISPVILTIKSTILKYLVKKIYFNTTRFFAGLNVCVGSDSITGSDTILKFRLEPTSSQKVHQKRRTV